MQIWSTVAFTALMGAAQARMLHPTQKAELEQRRLSASPNRDSFCDTPVAKEKVVFPDSLAGRANTNFDMYSGYVNISSAPDYLFYWLFETQDGNPDAPLVIWTNGGPGCTAMEGATTEHGPLVLFDMKESCSGPTCDYNSQLSTNPYAWNAHANVLYLDQPKNVGYSFGYGEQPTSSVEAADDFVIFYNEWLNLFPEFRNRELIISGESYGGHYIPAWSNAILNYNEVNTETPIPLQGVVIGNGCVNDTVQNTETFVEFQHEAGLIPEDANPKNMGTAEAAMVEHIGYTPNYYDYRLESISCSACYSYNYTAWSYWFLEQDVLDALHICGDAGNDAFAGNAGGCISMGAFDSRDNFDYSGALARTLEAKIPVSVYFGKTDTACQYVGGKAMVDTLSWNSAEQFVSSPLTDIEVAGVSIGKVKAYAGLSYYEIDSAGHMVPMDQPVGTAVVLNDMLKTLKSRK
jgi:cathepsin A (carboxypeptidase C)